MPNHTEIIELLDDAQRAITEAKRQLRHRTNERRVPYEDDVPHLDEWDRNSDRDKWSIRVGRLKLVIYQRNGRYRWYVYDRDLKMRIASANRSSATAIRARNCVRGWYLRNEYQGA